MWFFFFLPLLWENERTCEPTGGVNLKGARGKVEILLRKIMVGGIMKKKFRKIIFLRFLRFNEFQLLKGNLKDQGGSLYRENS